jgi:hypothetical protein
MGQCVSQQYAEPEEGELGVRIKRFPQIPGEDEKGRRKPRPPPKMLPPSKRYSAVEDDPLVRALQRRVDASSGGKDKEREEAVMSARMAISLPLPSRASQSLAHAAAAPDAPGLIFKALHIAVLAGNIKWATSTPEVALLLSDDVVFTDLRGETVSGKEAVLVAMNEAVERLLKRISGSTRSGKEGQLKTNHMKLQCSPLTSMGQATWSSVISIRCAQLPRPTSHHRLTRTNRLYLMTVRIRETYIMDENGKIKQLKREMASKEALKVAAA